MRKTLTFLFGFLTALVLSNFLFVKSNELILSNSIIFSNAYNYIRILEDKSMSPEKKILLYYQNKCNYLNNVERNKNKKPNLFEFALTYITLNILIYPQMSKNIDFYENQSNIADKEIQKLKSEIDNKKLDFECY